MATRLDITLYIPCYNAAPYLDRVLPAVRRQSSRPSEVLIIDDGSTDDTVAIAERHGFRVIRHDGNRGLGAARNTGVRAAETGYVASLDADVVPRPDWLERLAANLETGEFVGACGNLIETVTDTLADRFRAVHMQQGWGKRRLERPKFLYGNNNLYLKQALLDAGLYDESLRTNGEDVTMSANLKRSGAPLVYDPSAVCEHLRSDTAESICRTYFNYHFFDQDPRHEDFLRHTDRRGGRLLRRRFRRDVMSLRFRLALFDLWMAREWRRHARRLRRQALAA